MKKIWEKYKVLIIVILAIGAFVTLSLLTENKEPAAPTTDPSSDISAWLNETPTAEFAITVIGLSYCDHCKNFNPVITALATEYEIPLYWFDIDLLDETSTSALTGTFAFTDYDGSSPYTAITKNGEVVAQTVGGMEKEATIEFLKTAGAIK